MTKTHAASLLAVAAISAAAGAGLSGRGAPEPTPTAPAPAPALPPPARPPQPEVLTAEEEAVRKAGIERQARIRKRLEEIREDSYAAKLEGRQPNLNVNDGGAP